jgi:hypothetical protein
MKDMTDTEVAWLAGLLEGEGTFFLHNVRLHYCYPAMHIAMIDYDIIERVSLILGRKIQIPKKRQPHHKQQYKIAIAGVDAEKLMRIIRPYMGKRRGTKIDNLLKMSKGIV